MALRAKRRSVRARRRRAAASPSAPRSCPPARSSALIHALGFQAASSTGGAPSSISLRFAMPEHDIGDGCCAPWRCRAAARRRRRRVRPRPAVVRATAWRKGWRCGSPASVPRSAMTTMSIEARSNSSARARSLSLGRSSKENSIVLRMRRVLRSRLADGAHDVLRLVGVEIVDDAGDARCALRPRRPGPSLSSTSGAARPRRSARRAASPRTARPVRTRRRCGARAAARWRSWRRAADRAWRGGKWRSQASRRQGTL